ncbi:MAG: hypothetical protein DDG60_15400 [Anaerolineae bacterium]|nr:MAG: hypothetical protein DDG60_15400 [Anaerolineae bacterium]
MKNCFFFALAATLLVSCAPPRSITDEELLRFLWQNYPSDRLSFEQFRQYSRLKRAELDLTGDGQPEILAILTGLRPNTADVFILSLRENALSEMFYARKFGRYALDVEFHEKQDGVLLRWIARNGGSNIRTTDLNEEYIRCAADACDSLSYERYSWALSFASESESVTSVTITQPSSEGDILTLKQYSYQVGTTLSREICYDSAGVQFGISRIRPFTTLGPETHALYRWNDQSFELLSRRDARPELTISASAARHDSMFKRLLYALHDRWHQGNIDPNQIEQDFLRFFGLESPSAVPCGGETPLSLASGYAREIGVEVVVGGQGCRLQAWRQPDWRAIQMLDEIEIIGRFDFPCNPDTVRLDWNDLNGDGVPEASISSTQQFRETMHFFQISPAFTHLSELTGFLREPNFRGIEWEQRGERLLFYVGRPFWNQEDCHTSLSCYSSLEHAFDCYEWQPQESRFVPCPTP